MAAALSEQGSGDFQFSIMPTVTKGVEIQPIAKLFLNETRKQLKKFSWTSPISGVCIFPVVMDPSIGSTGDRVSRSRKDNVILVTSNISFEKWTASDTSHRSEIFRDMLLDSMSRIPDKHMNGRDKEALCAVIRNVGALIQSDEGK